MDKTINTTLIIGNGFDLSMGKHTCYKEFYEKLVKNKGFWIFIPATLFWNI